MLCADAVYDMTMQWSDAAVDCTSALGIDGSYVKAYMRRASAYEQSDDLDRALADYKKVAQAPQQSSDWTAERLRKPHKRRA
jgi:Tfp pilus assembly protein PilF